MDKCKHYKPYMDTLKKIVGGYYALEDCCSGGPLHILLDDDNYDIGSVTWCMRECFDGLANYNETSLTRGYPKEAYILGIMICNEYAKMTLDERAIFDAYMNGEVLNDCCGDCENCNHLGELYEYMKEAEERENANKE